MRGKGENALFRLRGNLKEFQFRMARAAFFIRPEDFAAARGQNGGGNAEEMATEQADKLLPAFRPLGGGHGRAVLKG